MRETAEIGKLIATWRDTGGSEPANTQSYVNGLCHHLDVTSTFMGKRASIVRPLLNALAGSGTDRSLRQGTCVGVMKDRQHG